MDNEEKVQIAKEAIVIAKMANCVNSYMGQEQMEKDLVYLGRLQIRSSKDHIGDALERLNSTKAQYDAVMKGFNDNPWLIDGMGCSMPSKEDLTKRYAEGSKLLLDAYRSEEHLRERIDNIRGETYTNVVVWADEVNDSGLVEY